MNTDRLNELFAKYIGNRLNEEEEIEFFELLDNPNNKERFESLFEALWETERQTKDKPLTEESLKRIDRTLKKLPRKKLLMVNLLLSFFNDKMKNREAKSSHLDFTFNSSDFE